MTHLSLLRHRRWFLVSLLLSTTTLVVSPVQSKAQAGTSDETDVASSSTEPASSESGNAHGTEGGSGTAAASASPDADSDSSDSSDSSRSADSPDSGSAASDLALPSGEASEGEGDDAEAAPSAPAHAARAPEPLAWRNSFFNYTLASTFNTFVRDGQLSYNPTVYQFMSLTPRWYLDPATFFFFSLGAFQEFTDADGTAYNREFALGDMIVELRRTIPWEGFVLIPAARLTFPTSKLSQAAQRYVNGALGLTVVRPVPEALGMTIALITRYQRWFAGSNVTLSRDVVCLPRVPTSGTDGAALGDTSVLCQGIVQNESDRLVAGLNINITPFEHFTVTLSAFWLWVYTYGLAGASVDAMTAGGGPFVLEPAAAVWRNFTYYALGVAYDITEWFNLNLTVANATVVAPLFGPDGSLYSPFNPDTQVALGVTLTLDGIYTELHHEHEGEEGLTPEERQRRRQGLAHRSSSSPTSSAF